MGPDAQRATPKKQEQAASEVLGLNTMQQSENQQVAVHELHPGGTVQFTLLTRLPDWEKTEKEVNARTLAMIRCFMCLLIYRV